MTQFTIRRATPEDAHLLPEVETSAGEAFRAIPDLAWVADHDGISVERHLELIALGASWIAEEQHVPIGFLSAETVSDELHIWELAVRREHQGRGVGRRLVETAVADARARDLAAVTLTTFSEVRWNAPFYAALGFTLLADDAGPRLKGIMQSEVDIGLPRDRRCAMRLSLR